MHYVSSEALLEMYFLQSTLKELAAMYGKGSVKLIKPSPQDEKWIGIDQAWVSTSMTDDDFLKHLKSTVSAGKSAPFFFAVFRQYKRVEEISKASKYTPYRDTLAEWKRPYYRCEIYTEAGQENEGIKISSTKKYQPQPKYSQHEALIRLSSLPNADVHYACPMIFTPIDVWKEPDMNQVRLVPVRPGQPTYAGDSERHHLCFRNQSDPHPEFHSAQGILAESMAFRNWVQDLQRSNRQLNGQQLHTLLLAANSILDLQTDTIDLDPVYRQARNWADINWEQAEIVIPLARNATEMLTIIEVSPSI
jgi:hypothetical protein